MTAHHAPHRTTRARGRTLGATVLVLGLLAVVVTVVVVVASGTWTTSGPSRGSAPQAASDAGAPGEADGLIAPGTAVEVDADVPAVTGLDPALRGALQRAAVDAWTQAQVQVLVSSGWRSAAYQQHLLDEAVAEHGDQAARELVQTPERSRHTSGQAVDVAFADADDWMDRNGAAYGLCRVYANEMWHFELLTTPGGTCPAQLPDATAG